MFENTMFRAAIVFVAIAVCSSGCGAPPTSTISGVVKVEGKPLPGGAIAFIPADGRTYQADIQSDGSYSIAGVPVGEAIVAVYPPLRDETAVHNAIKQPSDQPPPPPPPPLVPTKYSDATTTDLRCPVQKGETKFSPELKR